MQRKQRENVLCCYKNTWSPFFCAFISVFSSSFLTDFSNQIKTRMFAFIHASITVSFISWALAAS